MEYVKKGRELYIIKAVGNATLEFFNGYILNLKVSTDKSSILSDGLDTATIKAEVYNYLDEFQATATPTITFSLDGQEQVVTAVDGVATITFSSSQTGDYTFTASAENHDSGEVTINVKA